VSVWLDTTANGADHIGVKRSVTSLCLAAAFLLGACGSSPSAIPTPSPFPTPTAQANTDLAGVVWLCKPGIADNPCTGDLSTTVVDAAGQITVAHPQVATDPLVDCFFVYPTASLQQRVNADLSIDPEERRVAMAEAALFSQVCNVYAPIYPQLTQYALTSGKVDAGSIEIAYEGVRTGFADYLANYNRGRGIVFIGHSQGAMLLTGLLQKEVDSKPEVRKLLVSALLMGGNLTVPAGKTAGGDFANIPTCGSESQTGCVVAYSTFDSTPPPGAAFGRLWSAPQYRMFPMSTAGSQQIMCVNPGAPGGATSTLRPYWLTIDLTKFNGAVQPTPATPYTAYPNQLTAECETEGDATWLQVDHAAANNLPEFHGSEGPIYGWGLHDFDMHLAMGNLVDLVGAQAASYR
jgi:hypothetical protein